MGKPLVVSLSGRELPLELFKVERSDLYGRVEVETVDARGRPCTLATLADDGKTIIGGSGTALAMLTPDGGWVEKKDLIPTDNQGNAIKPVVSSYTAPVPLTSIATIDEYLSHNIRSVYEIASEADLSPLIDELKKGTIFRFAYSFRGGLEADAGFLLLSSDGTPFLAIGTPTELRFVGFDQAGALTEEEGDEQDGDIDFSMM